MCAQHQPKSIKLVAPLGNCRKFSCSSRSMASCSCACVWMNIALSCSAVQASLIPVTRLQRAAQARVECACARMRRNKPTDHDFGAG